MATELQHFAHHANRKGIKPEDVLLCARKHASSVRHQTILCLRTCVHYTLAVVNSQRLLSRIRSLSLALSTRASCCKSTSATTLALRMHQLLRLRDGAFGGLVLTRMISSSSRSDAVKVNGLNALLESLVVAMSTSVLRVVAKEH